MRITASLLRFSTTLALALLHVSEEPVYVQAASSDSGFGLDVSFNPREFTKRTAQCKAIKRDAGGKNDEIVDISLSYVEINPNPASNTTLVMVHGWPSLWSSWSYQIQEFKILDKHDYHLIIPDLRGFGSSTHPGEVKGSGTMYDLVGDLKCILDDVKTTSESVLCVGHDWGSGVCYEAARSRPDLFSGVVGVVVPYIPSAGSYTPVKHFTSAIPKLTYQLFFDEKTADAVDELDRDVRRTVRATLRTKASPPPEEFLKSPHSFLDGWKDVKDIPPVPFFTPDEEDYFVEQYQLQGFKNTLQFYTDQNRYASWKFAHEQGNHTIPQPVLAILPTDDPVADWVLATQLLQSETFLPDLTTELLPGAHWVHLENPQLFNSAMRKWLEERFPTRSTTKHEETEERNDLKDGKESGGGASAHLADEL